MKMITKIKAYFKERRENRFWRFPDEFIAAIQLNEGEKAYASVKKGLARLDTIPKPEAGYSYLDIIEIMGPVGKEMLRDDEINVYKALRIIQKSGRRTFSFKAIIPNNKDYFYLLQAFKDVRQQVEFPWSSADNDQAWRKGYCSTESIQQAEQILSDFCKKDSGRKFKDLNNWDYYLALRITTSGQDALK
jgi:hypothetical protein